MPNSFGNQEAPHRAKEFPWTAEANKILLSDHLKSKKFGTPYYMILVLARGHFLELINICKCYTCITFMYEQTCLHSLTHHMQRIWCENGVGRAMFTSKFSYVSQCETITHLTLKEVRIQLPTLFPPYKSGVIKTRQPPIFLQSCGPSTFNQNCSIFYWTNIDPKRFNFIFHYLHRFWEICDDDDDQKKKN
eukprot:TRINITY_DN9971_c0_g8_i1.p1 TRINITY_DN9971_c0_g8~~TRINITY_DN9971_c0_g8_i1.p1  ORF type:complete len:191 (-),score=4.40 TRINITY_DN9971_c0_g8_i1:2490-3062(-)